MLTRSHATALTDRARSAASVRPILAGVSEGGGPGAIWGGRRDSGAYDSEANRQILTGAEAKA
jgi:hypothetical protein